LAAPKFYIADNMWLSNAKVRHCCAFMAVPSILYLADSDICRAAIHSTYTVAFPWQ
jgi:hypothetical protein